MAKTIVPCPFCKGTNTMCNINYADDEEKGIRYQHSAHMMCYTCKAQGPRFYLNRNPALFLNFSDYRRTIEQCEAAARRKWNTTSKKIWKG